MALGVAFVVATLASRGDVDVNLGDDRFIAGSARDILDDIQERGAPLGFNDVANFARPIWVDNAGDDPRRRLDRGRCLRPRPPRVPGAVRGGFR